MSIIELHVLRGIYGAVNSGEDGEPKTMRLFDGTTRVKVSSQARKHAARKALTEYGLNTDDTAAASARFHLKVTEELTTDGHDNDIAAAAATVTVTALLGSTNTIALLPRSAIGYLATIATNLITTHPKTIKDVAAILPKITTAQDALAHTNDKAARTKLDKEIGAHEKTIKATVKAAKIPDSAFAELLTNSINAEVALCGRMVASNDIFNVDAAVTVADAFNVIINQADPNGPNYQPDIDFFSATDAFDIPNKPRSAHIGNRSRSASVFYEYATIDTNTLNNTLDGDNPLTVRAIRAFMNAIIRDNARAQNSSTGATNSPTTILATVADSYIGNLNHAFAPPIDDPSPFTAATNRLIHFHRRTTTMTTPTDLQTHITSIHTLKPVPGITQQPSINTVIDAIINELNL